MSCHTKLKVEVIEDPQHFDAALRKHTGHPRVFSLFTGAIIPSTGKSWCCDCVRANPGILKALKASKDETVLLECPVTRDEYKGNPRHPYRTHEAVQLQAVPTLIRWGDFKQKIAECVDSECDEPGVLDAMLA